MGVSRRIEALIFWLARSIEASNTLEGGNESKVCGRSEV